MTVSEPVKVEVEIEDLITGCTYVYKGNSVVDCKNYFLALFFGNRPHRVLYTKELNKSI